MNQAFHILVVDDEETMRRSLVDILRLEEYTVDSAASGEEAIHKVNTGAVDLILLDLKMPGIDGLEVLKYIRKSGKDIQIIMLTAHGSLESAIGALRQGAHDYLLKPCPPGQILESVAKGLKRQDENRHKQAILEQIIQSAQVLQGIPSTLPAKAPETGPLGAKNDTLPSERLLIRPGIWYLINRREVQRGNGPDQVCVQLTPAEGKLLQTLLMEPGRVFSQKELIEAVQGYDISDLEAAEILRPLMSRLRQKLNEFPDGKNWITNIRSVGYVFENRKTPN